MTVPGKGRALEYDVVIPNHNGAGFVCDAITAVLGQTVPPRHVIVVDDASTDDSVDVLRRSFESVRVLRSARNLGFGGAVNLGLACTSAPFVAILNSDARPRPDWAEQLGSVVVEHDVWALGSILVSPDGRVESAGDCCLHDGTTAKLGNGCSESELRSDPYEVFAAPGAAPVLRRSVMVELGGYDETYRMYFEDIDLAFRARQAGHRSVVVPSARVEHDLARSSTSFRAAALIARNSIRCAVLNQTPLSARRLALVAAGGVRDAVRRRYLLPFVVGRMRGVLSLPTLLRRRRDRLGPAPAPTDALLGSVW